MQREKGTEEKEHDRAPLRANEAQKLPRSAGINFNAQAELRPISLFPFLSSSLRFFFLVLSALLVVRHIALPFVLFVSIEKMC